jgi:hypothetical protein
VPLLSPRHADAYSPLWDHQLALWTPKAVKEGLNKRYVNGISASRSGRSAGLASPAYNNIMYRA